MPRSITAHGGRKRIKQWRRKRIHESSWGKRRAKRWRELMIKDRRIKVLFYYESLTLKHTDLKKN